MFDCVVLGPHEIFQLLSVERYCALIQSCSKGWQRGDALLVVRPGARARNGLRSAWFDTYFGWPIRLRRLSGRVFHIADQGLAWYARFLGGGKIVVTVHDVMAWMALRGEYGFARTPWRRRLQLAESARQIQRADLIVADTAHTAGLVHERMGVRRERIRIVHLPVDAAFRELSEGERNGARNRLFLGTGPVVVHAGVPCYYKNRVGAVRAFGVLRRRVPEARLFLLKHALTREETRVVEEFGMAAAVRVVPGLSDAELRLFYGAADVLLFPSLYEGFGWPPLEAMACGCPVVCSRRGSLPEVVGEAALTVEDPLDAEGIAEAAERLLTDAGLRAEMVRRGLERVKEFSVERFAAEMRDVYGELLGGGEFEAPGGARGTTGGLVARAVGWRAECEGPVPEGEL